MDTFEKILDKVNFIKPDVIFVAMTAPKQEKIASYIKLKSSHNFDHIFCIGAVIDYLSFSLIRPNFFITKYGFEWLHRLLTQPKSIWSRVLISGPFFFIKSFINFNQKYKKLNYVIHKNSKNLKEIDLTIITAVKNNHTQISNTLNSVLGKLNKKIEFIIIDGNSTDGTFEIINNIIKKNPKKDFVKIIRANDNSVYELLNLGIKLAKGNYISLVHSGDFYLKKNFINIILKNIKTKKDFYFCNCIFFNHLLNVNRVWFSRSKLLKNLDYFLIPHSTLIIKKNLFDKIGNYRTDLKISSDYDFIIRLFNLKASYKKINSNVLAMRSMGMSTNPKFFIKKLIEDLKINITYFKYKFIIYFLYKIIIKIPTFISEYKKNFYYKLKIVYKSFIDKNKFFINDLYIFNQKPILKLIRNEKKIPYSNKQFVLSGLNLAFLGSYANSNVCLSNKIYHWPDGVFFKYLLDKQFVNKIDKVSGANLLKNLKLPKFIDRILVIGNLHKVQKKFLQKLYKKKITHIKVGYKNIYIEIKRIKKINQNDLVLLTLPTPKQEMFADLILDNFKYAKILCVGGAINILTGFEKPVPQILDRLNLEFIWRLKTDTRRRIKRLIFTFLGFLIFHFREINKKILIKII